MIDPEQVRVSLLMSVLLVAGIDLAVAFIIRAQRESTGDGPSD